MNSAALYAIIGHQAAEAVVAGKYGDASLHAGGWIVADPSYILSDEDYRLFTAAHVAAPLRPSPEDARSSWHLLEWKGESCYWRDCSDGMAFGHYIDSGWCAAIPLCLCSPEVRAIFSPYLP